MFLIRRKYKMNKSRKIELLYRKAKGQRIDADASEIQQLRKYKVDAGDGNYATKANIASYVSAVDSGCRLSFYDWCMNNLKADRRRKGSSENEMAATNRGNNFNAIFVGWLIWGIAIYWIFNGAITAGACAVAGAIVSIILYNKSRRSAPFTLYILPIVLAIFFNGR